MKRRNFIKTLAAGVSSLSFPARQQERSAEQLQQLQLHLNAATDDPDFWEVVRGQFEISPEIIHLNCGTIGACPKIVTDALIEFSRAIERDPYRHVFGDGLHDQLESVREMAAELINVEAAEVAITRNTTEGMNIISRGLGLQSGDEILTTSHEHAGGMACWQYLAKQIGVKVVIIDLPGTIEDSGLVLEKVLAKISRRTRVFSFCHVDTLTGFVMPIAEIAREAQQRGIFFVCDGAQAPGMLQVDVKGLGVDVYVSSSHKWMLAPKGSGLLYVKKVSQSQVQSLELSSGLNVYTAATGTCNVAGILAHGVAIRFHQIVGSDRIEKRIRELNGYLADRLSRFDCLRRITAETDAHSSGLLTFAIDKNITTSSELAERLRKDFSVYVKPLPPTHALVPGAAGRQEDYNALRFSTHIFNNEEQIDRAAIALSELLKKN